MTEVDTARTTTCPGDVPLSVEAEEASAVSSADVEELKSGRVLIQFDRADQSALASKEP